MRQSLLLLALAGLSAAQSQPSAESGPVQAKRLPPEKKQAKPAQPLVKQYNFGAQVSALEDESRFEPGAAPVKPMQASSSDSDGVRSVVPLDYLPKTDVHLTETAREAVEMSLRWMSEH